MSESSSQRIRTGPEEAGGEAARKGSRSGGGTQPAPAAQELLRLQSTAGNEAVARAVKHRARPAMRPPDPPRSGGGSGAAPGGPTAAPPFEASQNAIVSQTKDPVKLHAEPNEHAKVVDTLTMNDRLFIGGRHGNRGEWRFATTASGHFGYFAEWLLDRGIVKTNLPDPRSRLHMVESGETALGIAHRAYGKTGNDLRFYVNVLEYVNRGPGQRGIYQPNPGDTSTGAWKNVKARAGVLIWIPSDDFAQTLKGVVKSGSITGGLWAKARGVLEKVEDFAVGGAAFVAGLVGGALASVKDLLVGLKDLITSAWNLLKTIFQGDILKKAKDLWDGVRHLKPKDIAESWVSNFTKRWESKSVWSRWQFRGWVIGYAITEIGLLIVSGGGTAAAKLATKMGRAASWVLKHVGEFATKAAKLAKRAPRKLVEAVRIRTMKIPYAKAWGEMSKAERKAFQHSYSRHGDELGLPKWSQKNADSLRVQFNNRTAEIRTNAQHVRTGKKPVNGVSTEVRIFEYTDRSGTKWYYYETLKGRFVSAGLDTR